MVTLKKNQPYLFMGTRLTPLLLGDDTNGEMTVLKLTIVKGLEPPMHRFQHTDELWKVLDGEMTFHFEDKTEEAKAGDTVFVPKGTLHTFTLKTGTATVIFSATSTDYEAIAAEFSRPASDENELPDAMPPADQASKVIAFSANHGLTFQTHK